MGHPLTRIACEQGVEPELLRLRVKQHEVDHGKRKDVLATVERVGDHAEQVEAAIAEHDRPSVCRASRICTTVLGKMLTYEPDQRFKPETWARLAAGIAALNARAAPPPARALR